MNYLSDEQLNKLTTQRLLALYKSVRKNIKEFYNWDESDIARAIDYNKKIKIILNTRPHLEKFVFVSLP